MIKFSKTNPSFLTVKEGSTFLTKPLFPQGREDVTALRCSEPLRYKVGGASKPSPCFAGWDRLNCSSLQYRSALVVARIRNIVYSTFDRITSGEVPIRVIAEILWPPLTICSKMEQKSYALFTKTIKHVLLDSLCNIQLFFANHYMNIHIVTTNYIAILQTSQPRLAISCSWAALYAFIRFTHSAIFGESLLITIVSLNSIIFSPPI